MAIIACVQACVGTGSGSVPDMQDVLRFTVVATGLNRAAARQSGRVPEREAFRTPIKLVRNATTGQPEFGHDDFEPVAAPAPGFASALRGGRSEPVSSPAVADFGNDSSYLDIPAFLRRQAD